MTPEQQTLYQRICDFEFDSPSVHFRFNDKLAQENGWTATYTSRVIDEYRRFAFLAVAAGHPISPSDAVDQAWHLHMLYTKSYWGEFCPNVLGRAFHHYPSTGGDLNRRNCTIGTHRHFRVISTSLRLSHQVIFGLQLSNITQLSNDMCASIWQKTG